VFLLDPLDDVDRPEDLPVWQNIAPPTSTKPDLQRISIIIPTLDEEKLIAATLASTGNALDIQRIVVDGGSSDRTVEVAKSCGAEVIHSPRGRARQMNTGAKAATGKLLLFLHADTCPPEGFEDHVRRILSKPGVAGGAFRLQLDAPSLRFRMIERLANWRSRSMEMPYGDQGIFVKTSLFREIGGFPDVPVMEDVELIRGLRKKGRIAIADVSAMTSARRWMTHGFCQTTLIHQAFLAAYFLGLSPSRLNRWYDRKR
jgi:rSAM/selenodomain-associated transferase 2